ELCAVLTEPYLTQLKRLSVKLFFFSFNLSIEFLLGCLPLVFGHTDAPVAGDRYILTWDLRFNKEETTHFFNHFRNAMHKPAGFLPLWHSSAAYDAGKLCAMSCPVAHHPLQVNTVARRSFKLAVFGLDLNRGRGCFIFGKSCQCSVNSWCRVLIDSEDKVVIALFWYPLAAGTEKADLISHLCITAPWSSQARVAVGDKVRIEVTSLRIQVEDGVGTGNGLFIPWLFFTDLLRIKWPRVIRMFGDKKQLDVVVGKF